MVMIMGALSETLAFLGSRLGALGRQARVAGLARLARPLVVVVVTAPRARSAAEAGGALESSPEAAREGVLHVP